jgi:hypothetical protein
MNNETTTETGRITSQLGTLAEIFTAVNLYASTDPNRGGLQLAKITGQTIETTDAYAALIYTITETASYTTTPQPFMLPAGEVTKALQAAAKLAGKRASNVAAVITTTPDTWTLHTNWSNTTSGTIPSYEWPNTTQIWHNAQISPPAATFEPFALAQWQIERLSKLAKLNGKDNTATLTHYSAPAKPMIYTTKTQHGHATALIMPAKITN